MDRARLALAFALFAGLGGATSTSAAQTLYGLAGNPAGAGLDVLQLAGPPVAPGPCPNGPSVSTFPAVGGAFCPGLKPIPPAPPLDGDITVNPVTDEIYAADDLFIARYASNGAFIDSFPSPLPIAGMGIDAFAPLIWITDGVIYGAIPIPPLYACFGPPPPFAVGPFPVPIAPGFFNTPITDIAFDPATGTLLGCDLSGVVGSFVIGPVFAPGPYGFFPVAPGFCPLAPVLSGIAFDKSFPGSGIFYVTDGVLIARLAPGGAPAPATFYSPIPCFPGPGPLLQGLGFSSRPITYGAGRDDMGAPVPRIGSIGQAIVPNPGLSITLAGSIPGSTAVLFAGPGPSCPPFLLGVLPVNIALPFAAVGVTSVDPAGTAFLNTPLPPVLPGGRFFVQWGVVTPLPSTQVTPGLHFTTGSP